MDKQEKKNRAISAYVSIGIHAILFVFFFVMLAWTEPDPPIPEYGIEFNLGNSIVSENQSEESVREEVIDEVEEVTEESIEESEETQPSEQTAAEEVEGNNDETVESEAGKSVSEDINSPDVVEKTTEAEEAKTQEVKETDMGSDAQTVDAKEKTEEEEVEKKKVEEPKIDDRAIFKKTDNGSGTGNKGSSLDLAGWDWDFKPRPNDKSAENGIIVFQIIIDEEGEIIGIKTLEKTVSPVVEKVYRDAVMELTFSKTAGNRSAAATSTGKITFIIQSK
ncbi:hypothetical protein SAMN04488029_3534 [Reichenbachiella faecimaris]|uniref:Protein TonB, links inner and outer membranes n=1 Tax=Reichenbachiella faecimaris TaxID=692418 RepID=A0A1W2GML4_REIFA|nr:hypothetical protein [Reichenbachiella faecimaris]SMD37910.1 hypothetical protein SAMN04488029_3534 [Reichenbachiella faecimaris]